MGEAGTAGKKSSDRKRTGGSKRAAASMICGIRREGMNPLAFQPCTVAGAIPVTVAVFRVPPSLVIICSAQLFIVRISNTLMIRRASGFFERTFEWNSHTKRHGNTVSSFS